MREAIGMCEEIAGRPLERSYEDTNRVGDHIWYVSDVSKFQSHFPKWKLTKNVHDILSEINEANRERWLVETPVTIAK